MRSMYLKQKGNRCGLYSYYNLANELHLPTRAEIRRILSERELCVANYRFYPGQGLYPEQLAMVISEHLPKGYDAHLISNDWNIFPPNCNAREVRKHLEKILRHKGSFRETHAKRQAKSYLELMRKWKWKITTEQITLDVLERRTDRAPLLASCLPMLLHPQMRRGKDFLRTARALRWDPEREDSHFFVVGRATRHEFKVIDSSTCSGERCSWRITKKDVHASIAMDDQPTLIQIVPRRTP
ncbi:hypothetical protein J4439_00265 [Candidatus Woesearchaeota archaeon]|nr:hypothetical protein [Candidatus Woesearchaeota archaeon]